MRLKTFGETKGYAKAATMVETLAVMLAEAEANALVHTLTEALAKVNGDRGFDTLDNVEAETPVETLRFQELGVRLGDVLVADTLETRHETRRDRLCKVQTKTLAFALAKTLAEVKAETLCDTMRNKEPGRWSTRWLAR